MEHEEQEIQSLLRVGAIVAICVVILLGVVFVWNAWTIQRNGKVVFHAGVTYTGPDQTQQKQLPEKFTVDDTTKWIRKTGKLYPYSFDAPETLTLVRFDNDPYDIYAVSYNNQPPSSHVLIGVDNLSAKEELKQYIKQPKTVYVQEWWEHIGGLSGLSSITPFTNSKGLNGYRAKFLLKDGTPTPYDDVFFEVPKRNDLVIHLSNAILEPDVFNRIVDSVSWDATESAKIKH